MLQKLCFPKSVGISSFESELQSHNLIKPIVCVVHFEESLPNFVLLAKSVHFSVCGRAGQEAAQRDLKEDGKAQIVGQLLFIVSSSSFGLRTVKKQFLSIFVSEAMGDERFGLHVKKNQCLVMCWL